MEKMTHDYIRQAIPEEISERGGALLRLVGGKTVPLETSIKEAKAAGYVLGDEELVKRQFDGLDQRRAGRGGPPEPPVGVAALGAKNAADAEGGRHLPVVQRIADQRHAQRLRAGGVLGEPRQQFGCPT